MRYLPQSDIFVMESDGETIGVIVLTPLGHERWEIKNVAVKDEHQGKGLGKQLVAFAIDTARTKGGVTLRIGTGNSGFGQLALYQKMGFRMTSIDLDFFTRNPYTHLEENGLQVRDMVILVMDL